MGYRFNMGKRRMAPPRQQRGVVLLIALIVLVAMTLAAIGMMRSVDTTTVIAGNVAFKQTTIQSADKGIYTAYNALLSIASVGTDKVVLNGSNGDPLAGGCSVVSPYLCSGNNINFPGYRATPFSACEVRHDCTNQNDYLWWTQSANWNGAPWVTVTDANGNTLATIYYWIHRMCTSTGAPNTLDVTPGVCQTYQEAGAAAPGSHAVGSFVFTNMSVFYRITSRSVGPRNTVAYSQSLVLLPE